MSMAKASTSALLTAVTKVIASVIISYNRVDGFAPGWHGDGRLFIHANGDGEWGSDTGYGKNDEQRARSVMGSLSHGFYGRLEVPIENVDVFYIYAGLNAFKEAIFMALNLKKVQNARVVVVACDCDWDQKQEMLRGTGIELQECWCGGQEKLGMIAKQILGVA
jgi:hypothetical protein